MADMYKTAHHCRDRRPGPFSLVVGFSALCVILLGVTGCSSLKLTPEKKQADPILGEVHPQNNEPYGPVPPPPKKEAPADTTGRSSSFVPPPNPLNPSPTSNAWLASNTKPLPGSQPLAINDRPPAPFQLTGNAEPLVKTNTTDPAFVNKTWVAPPTATVSGSAGSGSFTAQPGQFVDPQVALLQSRGITQHRVDTLPDGGIRLTAIAPLPGSATQVRTFDVTARDMPSAVQAVIQQLDQR